VNPNPWLGSARLINWTGSGWLGSGLARLPGPPQHYPYPGTSKLLVWNRPLSLQQPSTSHPTNSSLHLPLEAHSIKHTARDRTSLSASQLLYSIWITDLAQRQHLTVEEDPILDALSLLFIEGLVTGPHPWLFPKPANHQTNPLYFRHLLPQLQLLFSNLLSCLGLKAILAPEPSN